MGSPSHLRFVHNFDWSGPDSAYEAVAARLNELGDIAKEEGIPFNAKSREQARKWLKLTGASKPPRVYLLANGNTRLVWSDGERQIGIQFFGEATIQFVSLGDPDGQERVFGTAALSKLGCIIRGLEMDSVVGV
jgi:hypothetical protein